MAWDVSGGLVWATAPLGLDSILAVTDFDGDGTHEVFAAASEEGLFVLDAASGRLVWRTPTALEARLGSVIPLDVEGDGRLELYVADAGCRMAGAGAAHVYAFPDGLHGDAELTELDVSDAGYWCGQRQDVGDLDGDGLPEIVALSDEQIIAYSPSSGLPVVASPPLGRVPYGRATTNVVDLDGDGRAEILVMSDNPGLLPTSKRLLVAELVEGEIRVRFENRANPIGGAHLFPRRATADVIPGGSLEIVHSTFDPDEGTWTTRVIPGHSRDGSPAWEFPMDVIAGHVDLDGNGYPELLLTRADGRTVGSFATVRAVAFTSAGRPVELFRLEAASVPLEEAPWSRDNTAVRLPGERGGLVVYEDMDADLRADLVRLVAPDGRSRASRTMGAEAGPVGVHVADGGPPAHILVSRTDGRIELLDSSLSLANAGDDVDRAALVELNYQAPRVVVARGLLGTVDARQGPIVYDTGEASSDGVPSVAWRGNHLVANRPGLTFVPDMPAGLGAAFVDEDRSGEKSVRLVAADTGEEIASGLLPNSANSFLIHDVFPLGGSSGSAWLTGAMFDDQSGSLTYFGLDLADGHLRTLPFIEREALSAVEALPSGYDMNADGVMDLHVVQARDAKVVDGGSGNVLFTRSGEIGGSLAIADVNSDGSLDVLHFGRTAAPELLDQSLALLWRADGPRASRTFGAVASTEHGARLAVALLDTAVLEIYSGTDGTRVVSSVLAGGRQFSDEAAAHDAGVQPGDLGHPVALADMTGTGEPAFVVGSSDGFLYAVDAAVGTLVWSMNFRAAVGEPAIADVTGDGIVEIIVPTGDGHLYAVGRPELDEPRGVHDTDGSFVARSEADDLDELELGSGVGGNWESVSGATAYEYQLVRQDDLVVVPWTLVESPRFVSSEPGFELGERYRTYVRALSVDDGVLRTSSEVTSDGFEVVDRTPPAVSVTTTPSTIFPDDPDSVREAVAELHATDLAGIRSYRLAVFRGEREIVTLSMADHAGNTLAVEEIWDGRDASAALVTGGEYRIEGTVIDTANNAGSASATVFVCRDGDVAPSCRLSDDMGEMRRAAWQVAGGCGCSLNAEPAPCSWVCLWLGALWVLYMRRRHH